MSLYRIPGKLQLAYYIIKHSEKSQLTSFWATTGQGKDILQIYLIISGHRGLAGSLEEIPLWLKIAQDKKRITS